MYISIILKRKIDNHSFSRRKNSGFGVQSDKEGGDLTQFDKEGVGNIRGLHKKGGLGPHPSANFEHVFMQILVLLLYFIMNLEVFAFFFSKKVNF